MVYLQKTCIFAQLKHYNSLAMKRNHKSLLFLAGAILSMMAYISCGFNAPEDPEHPLFVSYSISASYDQYNGPDELLADVLAWVEQNSIFYDTEVNYSTGAASEFVQSDAEAIKKYDEFVPKFKAYLNEVATKLAKGTYGSGAQVKADFYMYVVRGQGESRNIKSEHVNFVYPVN